MTERALDNLRVLLETYADERTVATVAPYALADVCATALEVINQTPAADSWIKIEPGCEMPEDTTKPHLIADKKQVAIGVWIMNSWWTAEGKRATPTHYAVVRMPEAE